MPETLDNTALNLATAIPTPMTIRRNVHDPAFQKNIILYRAAVKAMKATPFPFKVNGSNVNWWKAQALIHANSCPHKNYYFFPWHRAYLFYFEKICRHFCRDKSFALPYWNWVTDPRIPGAFTWGDESSNALYDRSRSTATPTIAWGSISHMRDAISRPDFNVFAGFPSSGPKVQSIQGVIEAGPHNSIHNALGGNMRTMESPLDPLFWLHHCNVDRVWARWMVERRLKNQGIAPIGAARDRWLNAPLPVFWDIRSDGSVAVVSPSINSVVTSTLTKVYYSQPITTATTALVGSASTDTVKTTTIPLKLTPREGSSSAQFSVTIATNSQLQTAIADSLSNIDQTLRLTVANIPTPKDTTSRLDFYLNSQSPSGEEKNPGYIGGIHFFEHDHHGGAKIGTAFDLAPVVKKLSARPDMAKSDLIFTAVWVTNETPEDLSGLTIDLTHIAL